MKTVRIFIASSSELEKDRKEFREFLSVENDLLHKEGVYLELIQWEHFLDTVSESRLQNEYNEELKKCDIVIFLFYSKTGMYTLEEFETAYKHFKETGRPLIYTYFKSIPYEQEAIGDQALAKIKDRLQEIGHFYTAYESIGDLKYQFRKQLDRLQSKGVLSLQDEMRFLIGEKRFNEYLTKSLIESMEPYCLPAQKFIRKVGAREGWETQQKFSDKAKEIIAYSFVGVIGIQLSKLMAIGKEENSSIKQRKYIQKCLNIVKRSFDLVNFALLSKLWDCQKQTTCEIDEDQKETLLHRFDNVFELTIDKQFQLLKTLYLIFIKNKIQIPISELKDDLEQEIVLENSILQKTCKALHNIDEASDRSQFNLRDCFEIELLFADFFEHFAFLVNYKMASIKFIGYKEIRNTAPHYLHRYAALGIDSKANVDAEKVIYTTETVQTDAVLLYKGDNYQDNINLFPFVIDFNAITFEYGAKICFYRCNEISDGSHEYLFLEDNSIVNLEKQGHLNENTKFNELMTDDEKRKELNIDIVVAGVKQARESILDEINLDDILKMNQHHKYPFKFLDAYTREDSGFFFGREDEIEALYEMVFQTDLLLVYGASGTGKTSLIQCGLASKFESHDWLALNIRRGKNLNDSFETAVKEVGGSFEELDEDLAWLDEDLTKETSEETKDSMALSPLARSLKSVYLKFFKPIYFIFDQFEELYILGSKEEQEKFVETIKEILKVEQPVKVIISIREEYLGHLYEFERAVPELLRKKLRVEPMNLEKVKAVINGVNKNKESNVHLEVGEEKEIGETIFEKIKGEEKTLSIQLPYLQVFLDKLYLQVTDDESRTVDAIFNLAALEKMGDIGDVLRNFLDEQVLKTARDLKQKPEIIWNILSPFVTLDGTKEPISEDMLRERLGQIENHLIRKTLNAFVQSRILRFTENNALYEVAHDSLAKQIHAKRSDEEIAILEVQRLINSQVSLNSETREFFTAKQLGFVEPYLNKFKLSQEELDYLQESRNAVKVEKRKRNRTRNITYATIAIAFLMMTALAGFSVFQQQKTKATLEQLQQNQRILRVNQKITIAKELKNYGDSYWDIGKMDHAAETYKAALDSLGDHSKLPIYQELYQELQHRIQMSQ